LSNIASLRFDFGPSYGSAIGAIGLDDIMLVGLVESSIGVGYSEEQHLAPSLHPNPLADLAHLNISNAAGSNWSYRIYNALGTLVKERSSLTGERAIIHRAGLTQGLYLLEVVLEGQSTAIRFHVR